MAYQHVTNSLILFKVVQLILIFHRYNYLSVSTKLFDQYYTWPIYDEIQSLMVYFTMNPTNFNTIATVLASSLTWTIFRRYEIKFLEKK